MKKILSMLLVMLLTVQSLFAGGSFIEAISEASDTERGIAQAKERAQEEQWLSNRTQNIRARLQQVAAQPTTNALLDDVHNAIDPENPEANANFWKYCIKPSLFLNLINKHLLSSLVLFRYIQVAFGIELDQFKTWSVTQLFMLYQTLYSLPRTFVQYTKQLFRQAVAFGNKNILGYMYWSRPYRVYICDSAFNYGQFAGTVVHEMSHIFDANTAIQKQWQSQFYKLSSGRYVYTSSPPTGYGCTSIKEDIAESVRCYWADGESMKKRCPERYEFIRQYVMSGAEYR